VIAHLCTEINAFAGCNGAAVEPFKRAFRRPGDDKGAEALINYTAVPVGQQIMLYGESGADSKKIHRINYTSILSDNSFVFQLRGLEVVAVSAVKGTILYVVMLCNSERARRF
jgi:hypothetical protein